MTKVWCIAAIVTAVWGCQGDEECKSWAGYNGSSSWGQCGDKREREVKCDVLPKPGEQPPPPGTPVQCTCTLGGVVGNKFEMTDPSQLGQKESALRTANEQCGWKLSL